MSTAVFVGGAHVSRVCCVGGPGSRVALGVSRCSGLRDRKRSYGTDYCFVSADSTCCGMSESSTRGVEC